jgi:mannose-6-phosphate isomerase-like protein (cupin superfamily)
MKPHERNEASVLHFSRDKLFDGVHLARVALRTGENSTFHYHSSTRDTFFVMNGCLTVDIRMSNAEPGYRGYYSVPHETMIRAGRATHRVRLSPGDVLIIDPGIVHCAMNLHDAPCHFLCLEGVGEYDFIEV